MESSRALCSRQLPDSLKLAFLFVLTPLRQEKRKPELARLHNPATPAIPGMGTFGEIYCKELARGTVGTGRAKIHRLGWQPGAELAPS